MSTPAFLVLLLVSAFANARDYKFETLPWTTKLRACEILLQSPKADVQLPLDGESAQALVIGLEVPRKIWAGRENRKLFDPKLQAYIKIIREILAAERDPELLLIADVLGELQGVESDFVEYYDEHEFNPRVEAELKAEAQNVLRKLPTGLLHIAQQSHRNLVVTTGKITEIPPLRSLTGIIPRGWKLPWDVIEGAGGGPEWLGGAYITARMPRDGFGLDNLILHEFMHAIDYGADDLPGNSRFSNRADFIQLRNETAYLSRDGYMRNYPDETFAEFGAWYFLKGQKREYLRDNYPQWFEYFRKLEEQYRL